MGSGFVRESLYSCLSEIGLGARQETDLTNGIRNKIKIIDVDMKEEMKQDAIDIAIEAFDKYIVQGDIAEHIRTCFEEKYGNPWHCIVGHSIGISIHMESGHVICFEVDAQTVVLFKYGLPRCDISDEE